MPQRGADGVFARSAVAEVVLVYADPVGDEALPGGREGRLARADDAGEDDEVLLGRVLC